MRLRLAAVAALALPLLACTGDDGGSAAEAAAAEVAAELETGPDGDGPIAGGGADAYADVLGSLADLSRTVELTGTTLAEDGEGAEAALRWTWELPDGREWAYDVTAPLVRGDDDAWTASWSPALVEPSLAEGESLALRRTLPERADVLGPDDVPIVTERDVLRYGIDKTLVDAEQAVTSAGQLATALGIDPAYAEQVRSAGDKAFVEALVLRREDAAAQVPPGLSDIPGAVAVPDAVPLAPTREFALPILGRVGAATAEIVEESGGRVAAGDEVGLSGLQLRYDEQLAGTPSYTVSALPAADDGESRVLHEAPATPGEPLRLTLDTALQERAERALAGGPDVVKGLVAIRPSDGAILAAASAGGDGVNAATFGQWAPGSTFKIVTSLALLRSGLTADSPVECTPSVVVDGKRFTNYDDYPADGLGRIPLRAAFARSCNTALIAQADRLDDGALADAAAALGLGADADLGFPAYFGQVPPPESETEAAADMIGQGRVLASPMAMAAVAASVQAGRRVVPRLLTDVDGEPPAPAAPLTGAEARSLRALMSAVVTEGSGRFLAAVPGVTGAKTGTAEYGTGSPLPTHAWMVATTDRDLAVAVFVETGASGSRTAGPLLEAFLRG